MFPQNEIHLTTTVHNTLRLWIPRTIWFDKLSPINRTHLFFLSVWNGFDVDDAENKVVALELPEDTSLKHINKALDGAHIFLVDKRTAEQESSVNQIYKDHETIRLIQEVAKLKGGKIKAISLLRRIFGFSLIECKEIVES